MTTASIPHLERRISRQLAASNLRMYAAPTISAAKGKVPQKSAGVLAQVKK
jgi:hypothetical protein